jgi:hypothetical protein
MELVSAGFFVDLKNDELKLSEFRNVSYVLFVAVLFEYRLIRLLVHEHTVSRSKFRVV